MSSIPSAGLSIRDIVDDASEEASLQIARLTNSWKRPQNIGCEVQEGEYETRYLRFGSRMRDALRGTQPHEIVQGLRDMLALWRDPGVFGCGVVDADYESSGASRMSAMMNEAGIVLSELEAALRQQTKVNLLAVTPPRTLMRKMGETEN